jgi:hypothetical protein
MEFLDFSFGSFLYLIDWLGLSSSSDATGAGFNIGTSGPIGG